MAEPAGWTIEPGRNPSVIRVDTRRQLTGRTIETCPPAEAPPPLDEVVRLEGVRTVDLHRYRARINLRPGVDAGSILAAAARSLAGAWGPATPRENVPGSDPRAYAVDHRGPRLVAESGEMARSSPLARALFGVEGVSEVILAEGLAMVTLGRLFSWTEAEPLVLEVVRVRGVRP
jgi:hypothetical protein